MDIDLLRAFAITARSRTLTEAAERLGLSQSGLSRRLARLEGSTGAILLLRPRGGVELTAAGELLLRTADRVLRSVDTVLGELGSHRDDLAGDVRIHASSIPGEHLLPPLIASLLSRHPRIGIEVAVSDSADVVAAVAAGQADLGVCGDRFDRPDVRYRPLARDTLVLAVPQGHPLTTRSGVGLEDLVGLPLLRRKGGSGTQRVVEGLLSRAGMDFPDDGPIRAFGSTQATLAAVRAGIGLALVSSLAAGSAPGIRAVPLQGIDAVRWLSLVLPAQGTPRPTVAAIVTHLQTHAPRS